jgi:hypothetical protein
MQVLVQIRMMALHHTTIQVAIIIYKWNDAVRILLCKLLLMSQ